VIKYKELDQISRSFQEYVGCHGYEHTERVIKLCKVLSKDIDVNMDILIPASILHDIGRPKDNHAAESAILAREILEKKGFNPDLIKKIIHAIKVHSFSAGGEAKTVEARILSDADKLDAMGAIGIYRVAQYSVEHNCDYTESIEHFHEKLLKLPELLYTDKAKEIAKKRQEFLVRYLEQVDKENKGLV
jgi:uncharacterized protein